ncbi:MAG: iron ABC transporter ATP-binding protein [Hyphomicrobiales bacterium]|nr:MAG: iron ABC transporter ATP-binding protein [Hyphomicrobiales bacterium]
MLKIDGLSASYGKKSILTEISIDEIKPGELTAVIGPNGTGKSTFFKAISGLLKGTLGEMVLNGDNLRELSSDVLARKICYLPQSVNTTAALTAFEVVLLGLKFQSGWRVKDEDAKQVEKIFAILDIDHLSDQYIGDLSGGQQQLVWIAQAIIRSPEMLLLDEPTSALDLQHQLAVMDLLKILTKKRNIVTMVALHDLNLAARYADKVLVIKDGKLRAFGVTEDIFRTDIINETYGVEVEVQTQPSGTILVMPIRSKRQLRADLL